jgi:hypothetical protein
MSTRFPEVLGMLGVGEFDDEDDEDVTDDDELYDDDEDDFEDDEEDLDEEDEDDEDYEDDDEDEEDEELSGGSNVEAIYEQADDLLEGFQEYLKERGVAREARVKYVDCIEIFVDDYLATYEVGKLTDMNQDEIDTYLREFLLEREHVSRRKLTETKQALADFYTFLSERGHMPQATAEPIILYCQE